MYILDNDQAAYLEAMMQAHKEGKNYIVTDRRTPSFYFGGGDIILVDALTREAFIEWVAQQSPPEGGE